MRFRTRKLTKAPKVPLPKLTEAQIQKTLLDHLHHRAKPGVVYWHTPNGGVRDRITGRQLKDQGVVSGVPDLLLFFRGQLYGLELKTEKGRLQPTQVKFQAALAKQGAILATAYGLDEALKILLGWGVLVTAAMFEALAAKNFESEVKQG
ncbi:VRR-NUC domain-containing protein [Hyphomicrobium sp.]|uniref:VRR-NUC domain-containing protein n=1 Tax=Hyphomicrobium sp. TaxID=82 RepID=UPI001D55DD9A|nr:VRR-NUC domain-containing protein [Hyphomicrobium sp.]MBY0561469.1 VRR-NUC domain-containing protein [Hyphomicrobium sp.]